MRPAAAPRCRVARAATGLVALAGCTGAFADATPSVTPYRPSVSTPAALSAPGWLEVEAGGQSSRGADPARRQNLNYTLKLAFSPDWGIRLGGEALVHEVGADHVGAHGGGDTTLVLKRRFALDEASAYGLEFGAKLPTAARALGSGHADLGLNGIYSTDLADDWHADLNLMAIRQGAPAPGVQAWQSGWAAALSRNLSGGWGLVGELSGTRQGGLAGTAQALVAASWAWSSRLTVDVGTSKGLNTASGGWSVFAGLTVLTARLF